MPAAARGTPGGRNAGRAEACAAMVNVGLIGFGTIGQGIAEQIRQGHAGATRLCSVLVRDASRVPQDVAAAHGFTVTTDLAAFLAGDIDVVVEAAGHQAVQQYAEPVLTAGKDFMVISVGAFADDGFFQQVQQTASQVGRRVLVPSGAIGALDAISAGALGAIDEVCHTVRKPPRAFTADQLQGPPPTTEPRLLFEGAAREGVQRFPENVNVAAAVSLAGIGLERTRLRVFADPTVVRNTHEVEVRGYFGQLRLVMENIPSENPKTGRIVALSVAKALRNLSAPVVVGL